MATKPGILTNWPWESLGNFKYVILAPWLVHSAYSWATNAGNEKDLANFLIFIFLTTRILHCQIWVSYSRYRTAKGTNRIVDKGIDFEQVDRESNWDDQIILIGIILYLGNMILPEASHLPIWRSDGVIITILLHTGPVEFLYYWLHRALHHHYLYSRYHSHHHSSIVTEPITSVIHPFTEIISYVLLFMIPMLTTISMGTASIVSLFGYVTYIDFMNNMGHCNFEFIPKQVFSIFPPLKYFMYTPSFHSLHHTQFRTNYCLFMPFYDYIYGTMDKSSDALYEASLKRKEESPDVVHLTHLTTPDSLFHLRLGLASLASKPHQAPTMLVWPVTFWSVLVTWIYGHAFVSERNTFEKLKLQSWVVPRYNMQYLSRGQRGKINNLIEEAISEADKKGAKVLSLGLLNQDEQLNGNGELYIQRHPKLKIKVVDGSSLVAAVVVNSIPEETRQVVLRGKLSKVAYAIALALCQKGVKVAASNDDEYKKLLKHVDKFGDNLILTERYDHKVNMCCLFAKKIILKYSIFSLHFYILQIWLVGDGLTQEEQLTAPQGTIFIPFSQFPPRKVRKDCYYHSTPAMVAPKSLENMHSCENWLPRMVMSAWRVAGIVHGLEGWDVHECGHTIIGIEKVWEATLQHGFRPLSILA
ncbi:protein ECERIFERUM 1-like isoform X2 [Herrania umbratica]|uniref:Protein ECERIFERUM 1-like isoform X2 n=1 Tax=Herrania umbratica TaxID=108875 RepID=A0A6J1AJ52_9ROSI|nr:protein ECERIFERUM 1-like isoform X2 [Herrania umbratica]